MKIRMLVGPRKGEIVDPCTKQAEAWITEKLAEAVTPEATPAQPQTLDGEPPRELRKWRNL